MTAEPPAPRDFPRDDRRIYDHYIAGRRSAALAVGVRGGLFDALAEGPLSADALAARLGWKPRPVRSLVAALVAMEVLRRDAEGRLALAPEAADYLVRGRPGWLGGLVDLEIEHSLEPRTLLETMTRDASVVYGGEDPWEAHAADPEKARRFTAAMHSVSERPAAAVAERVDFSNVRSLLDVGGGSGALSLAIARAWPGVRCTVWDLAAVCPVAEEYARAAGLADRVVASPGDMFADPFPTGHDAVLLSQILHDWSPEKGAALLAKAAEALPRDGIVLVHEKLVDDDGSGPLANALVHLDMLVWTEGQQYTEAELRAMLVRAGFRDPERIVTTGYWSVMRARR